MVHSLPVVLAAAVITVFLPQATAVVYPTVTWDLIENASGDIELTARVRGGWPAPNKFTWTLPDNTQISPGQSSGNIDTWNAKTVGNTKSFRIVFRGGYTSYIQRVELLIESFRRDGSLSYYQTRGYTIDAKRKATVTRPATIKSTLTTRTDYNNDGSVTLSCTVAGGNPRPDRFEWTLPNGRRIRPGQSSGSFSATYPTRGGTYKLELLDGLTRSQQTVTFRVEVTNGWRRSTSWTLPRKPTDNRGTVTKTTVYKSGKILGNAKVDRNTKVITIEAEVVGGNPAPNTYVWTIQRADGSTFTARPGQWPASRITINHRGNPTTTLTITEKSRRTRKFSLRVTSAAPDGFERWWSNWHWTVSRTAF